jgi:hypothetical protein
LICPAQRPAGPHHGPAAKQRAAITTINPKASKRIAILDSMANIVVMDVNLPKRPNKAPLHGIQPVIFLEVVLGKIMCYLGPAHTTLAGWRC